MAKVDEEPFGDAPGWMLTYSDVITLLMTFFVLLLTFATDEPENFERMRTAMFGGGPGSGIAGPQKRTDQDSVLWRERSLAGRLPQRGSEMPPLHSDPSLTAVAQGLTALDEPSQFSLSDSHGVKIPFGLVFGKGNKLSAVGVRLFHSIAGNVRSLPFNLQILVSDIRYLDKAIATASFLVESESLPAGRIGVGVKGVASRSQFLWLELNREQ